MNCRFSIIIPVYNVKEYLAQCLASILNQSFSNFEILCVDDCSTDGSYALLEQYAQKDSRIQLYKLEQNSGQGVARNKALDLAQGEYILFVDPDDWIETDMLNILDEELTKTQAEVLLFGSWNYEDFSGLQKKDLSISKVIEKLSPTSQKKGFFHWREIKKSILKDFLVLWGRTYSRTLIEKYNIRCSPTRIGEDNFFVHRAILCSERIFFIDKYLYFYRTRSNSSLNKLSDNNFAVFDNMIRTKDFLISKGLETEMRDSFKDFLLSEMKSSYQRLPHESRSRFCKQASNMLDEYDFKKFLNSLEPSLLEKIFSVTNMRKNGVKHKIIRIFGFTITLSPKKQGFNK